MTLDASAPIVPTATPAEINVTPSQQAAGTEWTTGFNDDLKGYVHNKGFKDPSSVVDSYRNLEKLMGAPKERLLRLPEKPEDAAWNDVYQKLGRPEKPEEYKFQMQDPEFGKWAQGTFHKLGLSSKQAESLVNEWNGYQGGMTQKQQEAQSAKLNQEADSLKTEWGAAYEQNVTSAKRAAAGLGINAETIDSLEKSMGFAGVMKFMNTLGSKLGEDSFVSGGGKSSNFGVMTPEGARDRIKSLRGDPSFVQKYTSGDVSAREEMDKLHRWAYPE